MVGEVGGYVGREVGEFLGEVGGVGGVQPYG